MAEMAASSKLHVEGPDDLNSIANLIKKYGIDFKTTPSAPQIKFIGDVDQLLEGMETAVEVSSGRIMGFVLDADSPLADRWASVRQRLMNCSVDNVPPVPSEDGFIGRSSRFNTRVGVWLMPDNLQDGTLEIFLQTLVGEDDAIISHAESSTKTAMTLGAKFKEKDRLKATIHAWLAWQNVPGLPYGTAINAKYFRHNSPVAKRFVGWFVKLYNLPISFASETLPPEK